LLLEREVEEAQDKEASMGSMGFDLLPVTLDELWAVHDYVRQHDKLGQEWDKDFTARVMAAILEAQEHPSRHATLMCAEDELWQIDRQVPSALMTGTQPVGRNLLLKVMRLIVKMRGGEQDAEYASTSEDAGEVAGGGPFEASSSR
jgi:hypothetical protein